MGIRARFTDYEISRMTKREFMRNASFDDMLSDLGFTFRVAYYARESTLHEEQIRAFEIQVDMLTEIINKPHFIKTDDNKFSDLGKSGLIKQNRADYKRMITQAENRMFDILVIDSLSRLGRFASELLTCIDLLKSYDIGILITDKEYWTMNLSESELVRICMEAGQAQAESKTTGNRVKRHMQMIADSGQLLGGDLFGYKLVKAVERKDNFLSQIPEEAYTVRVIFEKYTSGEYSTSTIIPYLIENKHKTFSGDYNWTPSKINRILRIEKYMGWQMFGKSRVVDTYTKERVNTHIEPIPEDVYDEYGTLMQKKNMVCIADKCPPIVSEEMWWKAYYIRIGRSKEIYGENRKIGCRTSIDVLSRKSRCSCGYSITPHYTHCVNDKRGAQIRYMCRWQENHKEVLKANMAPRIICDNPPISDVKFNLISLRVFDRVFGNGQAGVLKVIELIEKTKRDDVDISSERMIEDLENKRKRLEKRKQGYMTMLADEDISQEEFRGLMRGLKQDIETIDNSILNIQSNKARAQKKVFDFELIRQRLQMSVDLRGTKVSDEMIDMFVEEIIYRKNDEFLWVMDLEGNAAAVEKKKLPKYSEEYSQQLQSDDNYIILEQFVISEKEAKEFVVNKVHRRFIPKFWRPITVKVGIRRVV